MKVLTIVVVLAALAVAVNASRPLRKTLKPALIEKKSHSKKILPHPTQFYRPPNKENKSTPGKACHEFSSCEECANLHICVWTVTDGTGACLDERDPKSVYGSRESCEGAEPNGYKDVTSREEAETEEVANMIGDADMAPDDLGGDRVIVHAVDADEGELEVSKEDKEKLNNLNPKWAKHAKHEHTHYTSPDGKSSVHTHTVTVTTRKGGMPHDAPPATGGDAEDFDAGETGQEDATEEEGEADSEEVPEFREKREEPTMDHIHQKYHALEQRVSELEAQIAGDDGEDDEAESLPEAPATDDAEDELADEESTPVEYGAEAKVDVFAGYDDPKQSGEHEPIVKETTVTKITKNEDGEVVGQPVVTKTLEQLDDGNTDLDP